MHAWPTAILILPAACLLAVGLVPSRWANGHAVFLRHFVTQLAGLQFLVAVGLAIASVAAGTPVHSATLFRWSEELPIAASVYYDGASSLMLLLVSFVGWVICKFSHRYLDGDAQQGRYFRWTAVTIGAVSLMAISGSLLMFALAWVMTSFGLHHLLLHFPDRPAAQRAAWTKFVISRVGDVALISALILTFVRFKTLDFAELFAALPQNGVDGIASEIPLAAIGWLFIAAAILKSAQFPFHSWLPQTMETPTPVSALMHAGIVNAGGYLLIRMSPLVVHAPSALTTLAIVGAVTAVFGGVVMMTQSSVKQALAYSTIAQMGFMMLQCGLGAFTAAMLHLLAHSLYKAHAFLSSGSVLSQGASIPSAASRATHPSSSAVPVTWVPMVAVFAAMFTLLSATLALAGTSPTAKPGGVLLGFVLCLALTHWVVSVLSTGNRKLLMRTLLVSASLCIAYVASFLAVDKVVASSLPASSAPLLVWLVATIVILGFGSMFLLHRSLAGGGRSAWMNACYVHACNGFYIDAWMRRVFGSLASS